MIIEYQGKRPKIAPTAFIAPTAVIIGDVEIGDEASVWFGVVIRGDHGPIRIGARTNVQDNSVIHVGETVGETIVKEDVTIGHSAMMEDCIIESGSLIGMNAVILNGAHIGSGTIVAAGSVVAQGADIPAGVLIAGAPAKIKKTLDAGSHDIKEAAAGYVELSRSYLEHGIGLATSH